MIYDELVIESASALDITVEEYKTNAAELFDGQNAVSNSQKTGNTGDDSDDGTFDSQSNSDDAESDTSGSSAAAASRTTDCIKLEPGNDLIVDTVGDPSNLTDSNAPKRVKDMSKAERQACLEGMRRLRAERNAAEGTTKLSKKERSKAKVGRR